MKTAAHRPPRGAAIRKIPSSKASSGPAFNLAAYLKARQRQVEDALEQWMPPADRFPPTLHAAIRHSLFSGGKRLRPVLVLAAAETCGAPPAQVMPAACALECIHTYSLIHDDLPAMDDDDWRRGRPTCHKAFGEAAAILAGDALLTLAFGWLAGAEQRRRLKSLGSSGPRRLLEAVEWLAQAAGMAGMVGGQMADIEAEGKAHDLPTLQYIHVHKTGKLIQSSLLLGGMLSGAGSKSLHALGVYGESLGLAFQITDDILDIVGNREKLGKNTGKDEAAGKATYPAFFGLDESRRQARELMERGRRALRLFGTQAAPLLALAEFVVEREV